MKITTYTGRRLMFPPRFVGIGAAEAAEAATVPNLKKGESEGMSKPHTQ